MELQKTMPGTNTFIGLFFLTTALIVGVAYRRRIKVKDINWKTGRGEIEFVVGGKFRTIEFTRHLVPPVRFHKDKQMIVTKSKDHVDAYIKKGEKILEHVRLDFKTETITKT